MIRRHLVVASLLAFASGLPFFSAARAQEKAVLHGRVVWANGEPVPSLTVALHRVANGSGTVVGQGLSGQEGRFEIEIPPESVADAVYFAATEFQGEMYIGQPFRPPVPAEADYVVVVGPGGVSVSAATGGAAPEAAGASQRDISPRAVLLILAAIALILAILVLLVRRQVPRDAGRRRALLEMAILEENVATGQLDDAQRAKLEQKRAEMRRRLTTSRQ